MPTRTTKSAARAILICLLALAVLGFRAPVAEHSVIAQAELSAHHHHGHSHNDENEPSAAPSGYDHDRTHVGDHSHDTPTAAVVNALGFIAPKASDPGTADAQVASLPTPPGDRPPRNA